MAQILLAASFLLPFCGGLGVFFEKNGGHRKVLMVLVFSLQTVLATVLCFLQSDEICFWKLDQTIQITLRLDGLGKFFLLFFSVLWLLVTVFSVNFLENEEHLGRFYGFYLLTFGALCALALAENLFTMYLFYEVLTFSSLPLLLHERNKNTVSAALKYLGYSVCGAALILAGFFLIGGDVATNFSGGHGAAANSAATQKYLLAYFFLMLGFGCKAEMMPLHAWAPTVYGTAPVPIAALLSGTISKAGVLAVIRCTFFIGWPVSLAGSWAQNVLLAFSICSVFVGSMLALKEKNLKKRLAYSTISQVSYALYGLFLFSAPALTGSLLQILFHGAAKIVLFLVAGLLIAKTGSTEKEAFSGAWKTSPVLIGCFAVASLSLVGIPPTGGFLSKWYLAKGALASGGWSGVFGVGVLLLSALLTAGYLLPLVREALTGPENAPAEGTSVQPTAVWAWLPVLLLAVFLVLASVFPSGLLASIERITANLL